MRKVLVFFPTYNEVGNVERLLTAINEQLPTADILVVDDASPDGTGELLDRIASADRRLKVIHRPGKLGLGSAHKIAMMHARDHGYDALVTMDADFSHPPRYLPTLLEHLEHAEFVTGSRYAPGGRCDYGVGRQIISRTANIFAKAALGLKLAEHTTMYRGFTRSLLSRMNIEGIRSEGYSFAVDCLHQVSMVTDRVAEFPIHFEHRATGSSKISQVEIYKAILTLERLFVRRMVRARPEEGRGPESVTRARTACCACGGTLHSLLYPARLSDRGRGIKDASPYSCATHSSRSHGEILKCLQCGLIFMRPKLSAADLVREYSQAVDPVYLENIQARIDTFRYNLNEVRAHIKPGDRVLEIGSYCGAFLKVAREEGIDIVGLEPSRWAVQASSNVTDAKVIRGTTDDVPRSMGNFDVITAWDVLEHFADPVAELKKMHGILADDGTLLFSTLMIDNWFPKAMGQRWPWLMDMHLFYFTESTIRQVLNQTGFEIIESRKYCHIVTFDYLMSKLGTLGVPLANTLSDAISGKQWAKTEIPFRFGDIKLFVCKKTELSKTGRPQAPPVRLASAR
jgi:SAM-dependent methyltransferase